jgi:hypothetical protein
MGMMKAVLATIGLVSFMGVANAESVVLKTKHYFDSNKKETIFDFKTKKACGLKSIAIAVGGQQVTYLQYSQVVVSYDTGSDWVLERDNFTSAGLVLAGDQSKSFELSGKEPCIRKVFVTGALTLWPTTQATISIVGEK